jgi:uncharacterized membrane protein YesL
MEILKLLHGPSNVLPGILFEMTIKNFMENSFLSMCLSLNAYSKLSSTNLSQLSIINDKTKYLFVAPSCFGSICMKLVNAKGKIVEKFYIKVGTLSSITSSLQITPS